ncbi:dTDP-4-dehydrorhamnose reductase [Shewanella sedimentimangrovi]|uniref:dTDP-4-dehydrorhamnose reductase n=1 Tax=Shewanella sedimentimangrovi TaxID=2814293 RepID=A0ABX7QZI5_9GAMM|nr:dTDP-4-dehydrorhamnose reductase [Shewanella sedimentimangrovi]QSX36023.1 dTDP-4-dehydrorhamnose reductase [Shewanella sedimentimangrovi]
MKVLITGGRGQVANALLQTLPEGWQCVAPDHEKLDISNAKSVAAYVAMEKPDLVINCAAYTAVDFAEQDAQQCYAVNRDGAAIIAEMTAGADVPLIHLSTDYVFNGRKAAPYTEDDLPAPLSVYGKSKLAGELVVMAMNPRHIILRTSWVFSAEGHNFVRTMLRLGRAQLAGDGNALKIVTDQIGGPTPAKDLAMAIWTIAVRIAIENNQWGIYHYSGTPCVSWFEFALQIFSVAKLQGLLPAIPLLRPVSSAEFGADAARPRNSCLNNSKIHNTFLLQPSDWRKALRDMLKACKN